MTAKLIYPRGRSPQENGKSSLRLLVRFCTFCLAVVLFSLGCAPLSLAKSETKPGMTAATATGRGYILCGVNPGLPGFANPDKRGNWSGIDVDFCRSIAAALLMDANKVKYVPVSSEERFKALESGTIDILSRNTTWNFSRDTTLGLIFAGVLYYDGQGFMVRKDSGVKSVLELNGTRICVQAGTTSQSNLGDFFRTYGMVFSPLVFGNSNATVAAYNTGLCDAITTDQAQLYAQRPKLEKISDHLILPEIVSKEPLGPVVRQGDNVWLNVVRWTLFALINAEESGITSKNVDRLKKESTNPTILRMLGSEGDVGLGLGLDNSWVYRIIKQVGNYGELYDNNLGKRSSLNIKRGLNALWSQGGLHYAPPIQ